MIPTFREWDEITCNKPVFPFGLAITIHIIYKYLAHRSTQGWLYTLFATNIDLGEYSNLLIKHEMKKYIDSNYVKIININVDFFYI